MCPLATTTPGSAAAISAGFDHSCAVLFDSTAACWGRNYLGRLGDGLGDTTDNFNSNVPVAVVALCGADLGPG